MAVRAFFDRQIESEETFGADTVVAVVVDSLAGSVKERETLERLWG